MNPIVSIQKWFSITKYTEKHIIHCSHTSQVPCCGPFKMRCPFYNILAKGKIWIVFALDFIVESTFYSVIVRLCAILYYIEPCHDGSGFIRILCMEMSFSGISSSRNTSASILTLNVRGPRCLGLTRSISWLLISLAPYVARTSADIILTV